MAKDPDVKVSVTEVSISSGRRRYLRVEIDGRDVQIPVDDAVYQIWQEQFVRGNPTALQRRRFATFMNVVRAAYKKGHEDGRR